MRKVLYIHRDWSHKGIGTYLRRHVLSEFYGQDGFFEAALESGFLVDRVSAARVFAAPELLRKFDAVFVNSRQRPELDLAELSRWLGRRANGPLILFVSTPHPEELPPDEILDPYDIVVKREPFRDLSRYKLRPTNLDKLRRTMLACHLVKARRGKFTNVGRLIGKYYNRPTSIRYDIFFSGIASNPIRCDAWERVIRMGIHHVGGIQQKPKQTVMPLYHPINGPKMSRTRYIQVARQSRVNLALDGTGPFTYRHLELWCAGTFMLSSPGIREISTPMGFQEGVHYVAFDDLDDMEEKIRHYLHYDNERRAIAEAGQKMFLEEYNISRHAQEIQTWLSSAKSA